MRQRVFIIGSVVLLGLILAYVGYRGLRWWRSQRRKGLIMAVAVLVMMIGLYGAYRVVRHWWYTGSLLPNSEDATSNVYIAAWLTDSDADHRAAAVTRQSDLCKDAPFILPSEGFIGLLWGDPAPPYTSTRRHTGIDIFGDGAVGTVPVVAVYDGWLTREEGWKSTVIIRHDDPLQPGRTIWTYYTHMADLTGSNDFISDAFPPGTSEVFVRQGTLLGYQGLYAGTGAPIAMHVHLSIVGDDGETYLNEGALQNTIDPSPYFDLPLNIDQNPARPIRCLK